MILADKIIMLRKKCGYSQEELADKMNVSRQSVSKWESAQSTPDLEKIIRLSEIFNVSTDFLLKDEIEESYATNSDVDDSYPPVRRVSMMEATEFLRIKALSAKRIALAVNVCILSPLVLIFLIMGQESQILDISEEVAIVWGLIVLLLMVSFAVVIFLSCGALTKPYLYLEEEEFETEYGVSGMVKERMKAYSSTYTRYNILGTCICILSTIPLFLTALLQEDGILIIIVLGLALTMIIVGIGVAFFIVGGINQASFEKLLQEGDYARNKKRRNKKFGPLAVCYWVIIVAIYLMISFSFNSWDNSWIIWPVAALVYVALVSLVTAFTNNQQ